MYILEEDFIKKASQSFEYSNSYAYLLEIGFKYKESGLTPIYIYDSDENSVFVTTQERMQKKLN